jgi:predicted nucleotidyltransferase
MMARTPTESEAALRQAVERIATRFHPDKIILFGSRARGQGR